MNTNTLQQIEQKLDAALSLQGKPTIAPSYPGSRYNRPVIIDVSERNGVIDEFIRLGLLKFEKQA